MKYKWLRNHDQSFLPNQNQPHLRNSCYAIVHNRDQQRRRLVPNHAFRWWALSLTENRSRWPRRQSTRETLLINEETQWEVSSYLERDAFVDRPRFWAPEFSKLVGECCEVEIDKAGQHFKSSFGVDGAFHPEFYP